MAWNEEPRIGELLQWLVDNFDQVVCVVQSSTDDTLGIARKVLDRPSDKVLTDPHYGYGDRSLPKAIANVTRRWSFVISCDEWPTNELLGSLGQATSYAERHDALAVWIRFRSWIEDLEVTGEQEHHLRLFRTSLGWPSTLHSRPMTSRGIGWPIGTIDHRRSLDEMMRDYLRYYQIGISNHGWKQHNRLMMHDACVAVAAAKGWDQVAQHEWWPEVRALAFEKEELHGY